MPGERVVIVDNDGYFMGVSLAEKLAEEGKKVTLMTHLGHIAPYMHFTLEAPNMHRKLHKLGVEIVTYHMPTQLEEGKVTSAHVYDEEHLTEWEADAVVLVTQRRSNEALYRELKDSVGLDALAGGRASPASTGSATARRRGSSRTASSPGTGSRARSTPRTPRCPCRSSGSATSSSARRFSLRCLPRS